MSLLESWCVDSVFLVSKIQYNKCFNLVELSTFSNVIILKSPKGGERRSMA